MWLPPSTGPSGSRERRSFALVREDAGDCLTPTKVQFTRLRRDVERDSKSNEKDKGAWQPKKETLSWIGKTRQILVRRPFSIARLTWRGWKSSIAKPVAGMLPPFCSCTAFRRLLICSAI